MINNKYISLVLPCKDEGRALKEVLNKVPKVVDEIIVVDNNSRDKTNKTAKTFKVRLIKDSRNEDGIGYGFAHRTGIKETKGDIIICMDGDASYPVLDIPRLVRILEKEKLDFISCNRIPFKDKKRMSYVRTFGVKGLNLVFWLLYGYRIKDCLSGMWIMRRKVLNNLILTEGGWNLSLEIKLKAALNQKIRFAEMPIHYNDRIFDSSKQNLLKTGLQHLFFLLKKRFSYRRIRIFPPEPAISLK